MNLASSQSLERLRTIIREMRSVMVAFSGGVDSALVMFIAHEQLREAALACIGLSPSYPNRERRAAVRLLEEWGVAYRFVEPGEARDAAYLANGSDRCYFCRSALFARLKELAATERRNVVIVDGVHLDDVGDHVGGMRAAEERGVRSPLLEAGLRKSDVRELTRALGLSVWDKPAMACLASRIPHGTAITPALLRQIEAAEDVLADAGFRQFRVRHYGDIARIELPAEDLVLAVKLREALVRGIRAAGYRLATLDLAGFRPELEAEKPAAATASEPVAISIRTRAIVTD